MKKEKIIVFTCNWDGFSGLEAAGRDHALLRAPVYPLRVACLGRVSAGIILQAFEKGARAVLLLGCREEACHFGFGRKKAEAAVAMAADLLETLGVGRRRLAMGRIDTGDGRTWMKIIDTFLKELPKDPTDAKATRSVIETPHRNA